MPAPYEGFTISRYQAQKSSQNSLYIAINASDNLYFERRSSISALTLARVALNHFTATFALSGCCAFSSTLQPLTSRNAFQILLLKFRPCSHNASSKRISLPAGAESIIPIRTASAPYLAISSRGSGEFPSDFDILRPSLSLTIPVKYTFLKGIVPLYS